VRLTLALACCAFALHPASATAQGRITGTVFDSLSTRGPLANATVVLVERSRYATTDSLGRFRIDSVPDGHYTVGFMHALLDSLELEVPVVPVDVSAGSPVAVTLFTPSPAAVYAGICPGAHDTETGVIVGHVRDVDNRSPLANATVSTDWTEFTVTGGRSARHRLRVTAKTDARGVYLLCGVPTEVSLDVATDLAGFIAGPTTLLLADRLISRVDFALSQRDSAARDVLLNDTSKTADGRLGTASLRGVILGADGKPVGNAAVGVLGTTRSAHTDNAGAFRIDHIPAGTRTIEVKSLGVSPISFSVDFATNATLDSTLSVSRLAQPLKSVDIKGARESSASLMASEGFETRRLQALGKFVTETELARHPSSDLAAILASVQGLHVEYTRSGGMPYLHGTRGTYCIPNYFLDGQPFAVDGAEPPRAQRPFTALSAQVLPGAIKGIEIYANPGTVPAQYDLGSSTGCGSIVIWTR
jgi:hypothetical protein